MRLALFLFTAAASGAALSVDSENGDVSGRNAGSTGTKVKVQVKSRPAAAPPLDHSGRQRKGKASFYGRKLSGRKMADGTAMNPNSNVAASKTLPIGTTARVTNLNTGRSAVVEIRDRGPYVKGRIVDLSPKTAKDIGAGKAGVVPVEVAPIEVPQPDGSVKAGAGAAGSSSAGK
jgi:rare lipoprotein A